MEVFLVKNLPFLLMFGLMAFNAVNGGPLQEEMKTGKNDGQFLGGNILRRADGLPGFRKSVPPKKEVKDCLETLPKFFAKMTPPVGLRNDVNTNLVPICQQKSSITFNGARETYYTTLFDQNLGIAVYSAYKRSSEDMKFQQRPRPKWKENRGVNNQAGEKTYPQAPWQRGHLVPAHTLSSDPVAYRSTFRYTNAVPQRPAFNGGQWSRFERRIRQYAKECTANNQGELYLLTGTAFVSLKVDKNERVSGVTQVSDPITLPGKTDDETIHVPASLWTAGCCISTTPPHYAIQSFAVIGNNVNERDKMHTQQIPVKFLQKVLEEDTPTAKQVNLFPENPGCSERNLEKLPEYVKGDPNEEEEMEEEEGNETEEKGKEEGEKMEVDDKIERGRGRGGAENELGLTDVRI